MPYRNRGCIEIDGDLKQELSRYKEPDESWGEFICTCLKEYLKQIKKNEST